MNATVTLSLEDFDRLRAGDAKLVLREEIESWVTSRFKSFSPGARDELTWPIKELMAHLGKAGRI